MPLDTIIVFNAHWSSCYTKLNSITAFLLNVSLWYFILMESTLKWPPCNKNEQALVLVTSFTSWTEFYTFVMVKIILKITYHFCGFFFHFLELYRYGEWFQNAQSLYCTWRQTSKMVTAFLFAKWNVKRIIKRH